MAQGRPKSDVERPSGGGFVEMPRPTSWPIVVALAITMIALGAATDIAFAIVGGSLLVISVIGWIVQLLPGRGHEHEPLATAGQRAPEIRPRPGSVEQIRPGVVGYRLQFPEKVHPVSAGIKGGIVGGLLMPIPALAWGLWSGHGIWFPINLLAGMVVPGMGDLTVSQLEAFHPWALLFGIAIHVVMSLGIGLVYGVLLPTLPPVPGGPLLFGGIMLPCLWTGASYGLMGAINPVLNEYVAWRWFVASQLVYGIAASIVIMRSEKISIAPRGGAGSERGSPPPAWLGCFAAIIVALSGCSDDLPGKPTTADEFTLPTKVEDFATLYGLRCAGCHGAEGKLGPGPPLNDALFLALVSEEELHSVIADGRKGTLMPGWAQSHGGPLTDQQVKVLVDGLRAHWKSKDTVYPSAPPLVARAGARAGNAEAGAAVFKTACGECHGPDGMGAEMAGRIDDPVALGLVSQTLLRRYVITGRHDLGMPDFTETDGRPADFKPLTPQQVDDLVALLVRWRDKNPAQGTP